MPRIRITLKSDLCSGSGQGFSGIIDTDICHDKYGLPYIPARRLKGVLLDAAEYIGAGCETIEKIFGIRGNNKSDSIHLSSARIDGYEKLCKDLKKNKLDSQKILALFTSTKAQTALENDTADENSLRFTRTVNQYSPFDGNKLCFYAECDIGESYKDQFKNICKAVRNIGLERTRGLGAVRFDFEDDKNNDGNNNENTENKLNNFENGKQYRLNYDIILNSPLMVPGTSNSETSEYISGTSILGALAAEYLKSNNPDGKFEELFLKDNIIFGNAYLDGSIPAPLFLQKIKETGDIKTVFSTKEANGTPKPLKDAFVKPNIFNKLDIETEITYHHSRSSEKRGNDATLYTQKHLSEGQIFKSEIIGNSEYIREIEKLLINGIKIGRSKTAEYSDCRVENIKISEINSDNDIETGINLISGEKYVLALESDFIALDGYGSYTADIDAVFTKIGFPGEIACDKSFITTRRVSGYNTVWNLKKPHCTAIKAGSYITFKYTGETKIFNITKYFGEKNNEGFGKVKLYKLADLENFEYENENPNNQDEEILSDQYEMLKQKIDEINTIENVRLRAIDFANGKRKNLIKLNAAFVGRVALMVNQADDFEDLKNRVGSIKTISKKDEIENIIKDAETAENNLSVNYKIFLTVVFTLAKYWIKINGTPVQEEDED